MVKIKESLKKTLYLDCARGKDVWLEDEDKLSIKKITRTEHNIEEIFGEGFGAWDLKILVFSADSFRFTLCKYKTERDRVR